MNRNKPTARVVVPGILTFLLGVFLVFGCSAPVVDVLAEGRAIAASCADGQIPAELVPIDMSGTYAEQTYGGDAQRVVHDAVARTAVCGAGHGHLRVVGFAGSSAKTATLFDDELALAGATEIAQFRRLSGLIEAVDKEVAKNYAAASGLAVGSDITSQLRLADEFRDQLGSAYAVSVVVVSDGFQNAGLDPHSIVDPAMAPEVAAQVPGPDLDGIDLTFTGIGNVTGTPPGSQTTEALIAFYQAICARANANRCTVVTDYVGTKGR
jgi:hypothetical protein